MAVKGNWLTNLASACKRALGLDSAIAFTVLARGCSILGSTGTVLLIVRFLSPYEQGYYYSLLSLVNLQIIFELGFSFVIQQFAAHECVHLRMLPDGSIEGDASAHARLALVIRKTLQWYLIAGTLMGSLLLPSGAFFFARHANVQVAWRGPLCASVVACVLIFILNPFFSFLEGCGQIRQVAAMRLAQAIVGVVSAWSAFVLHKGLYSPAMVIVGNVAVGFIFLWKYRRLLTGLFGHPAPRNAISWRHEVWSFQWKIGVSWFCSYLTTQAFVPALFLFRNPIEAGRMGMSMSICGYLWNVVLAWMSTKATPFGRLIAQGNFLALDRLFFRTLRQSLVVLVGLILVCMAGVIAFRYGYSRLAVRMVPPHEFAFLLLTSLGAFIVQSEAIYLRAHKKEPFLWQSIAVALVTCAGVSLLIPTWGTVGAVTTYFFGTGVIGSLWATTIFQTTRGRRRRAQIGESEGALLHVK
jgi:hypothetical protein